METCPYEIDTEQIHTDLADIEGVDSLSYLVVGALNFDKNYLLTHLLIMGSGKGFEEINQECSRVTEIATNLLRYKYPIIDEITIQVDVLKGA